MVVSLEGDILCSTYCEKYLSHVTSMNDAPHVSWQAQYLMRLEGDTCCSADCR